MHRLLALPLLLIPLLAGPPAARAGEAVLVELYTSQGCSSCPPAEAYLADELAERAGVVALELHVDYWDYIGWRDPFADPAFTARQRAYARAMAERTVYTPQMIVDGRTHVVGSRPQAVEAAIAEARAARPADAPRLAIARTPTGWRIAIDGPAPRAALTLFAAGFDARRETAVKRGENAGARLVNAHVARSLQVLARWRGGTQTLTLPADALAGDGGIAAWLQAGPDGAVKAAAIGRR
ncbi:MAG: DUF1223 domain-containing protein [Marivibrio sp.]|uniref:DUF1223 domain-containing protein n=1 Tax=Marivibrio sp. TaxID=2039719 RepID=UPI0032EF12BA